MQRLDTRIHGSAQLNASDFAVVPDSGLPLPLPHGTISAHVRHGDKHKEMSLVSELEYLTAARRLVEVPTDSALSAEKWRSFRFSAAVKNAARVVAHSTMPPLSRSLFVSTEDAPAIGNLARAAAPLGWSVLASQIPRLNDGPVAQMKDAGLPAVQLTRLHFGQLLMALEADAWIGTYASNWCRLIDELRGVWVPKAAGPYVEVGVVEDYHVW